jgi:outer membrane biogenesis lipoprotein LolB
MTTFRSNRTQIARRAFVALLLTLIVLLMGCNPGLHHVRKGETTDPSWKETQQPQKPQQSHQVDDLKPAVEPSPNPQ